jgi:diketogulonate reductase-like aldo/keto reductase
LKDERILNMKLRIDSKMELNNGIEMPLFGLGVFRSGPGDETVDAVARALQIGYRLIDTARMYGNEKEVGLAVRKSSIAREEVFVTTKLWNDDQGYDPALRAFDSSIKTLGLDYVDLYLIHWPVQGKRKESWKALERIADSGRCRAIGVSNYTIRHLEEMFDYAEVIPAVNQVEFSPFLYQKELLDFCKRHKIHLEAYSPLTRGRKFGDPTVISMAEKHSRTPAQILLRWAVQHGITVIPKSVRFNRIMENADIFDFEISEKDMVVLDTLNENFRVSWDPTGIP